MSSYFGSDRIGSSILGSVVTEIEPLEICTDLGSISVRPTKFIAIGKQFEDLVEQEFSGNKVFDNQYFCSDIPSIPVYAGKDNSIKQILDMLEIEDFENRKQAIDTGYIYKNDSCELNGTYKTRHECLDEIRRNDYKMPVPCADFEALKLMLMRFRNYPFKIGEVTRSIAEWVTDYMKVYFQVEHFWKHENGAECRAKFDMVWASKINNDVYAMPFDLKVTANWLSFKNHWKSWYLWQSKHYIEGFKDWCREKSFIPFEYIQGLYSRTGDYKLFSCPLIWYFIQESTEPHITHAMALHAKELKNLDSPYNAVIKEIWKWIQEGKQVKGYMEQQLVNRWGKNEQTD